MSERPRIEPGALGALAQAVPQRIARRLDAEPRLADAWTWAEADGAWQVSTPAGEIVRLAGVIRATTDLSCSCLLSPRCLHVLAVASCLELTGEPAAPAASEPVRPDPPPVVAVEAGQRAAAALSWAAAAAVLATGAHAAGTVLQGELLRAVHAARATGLHRLGASGLRVVRALRELRATGPTFVAATLGADLADVLAVARDLCGDAPVDPAVIGAARRTYEPLGSLQLSGICCEPVVSAAGFGGVVSWLVGTDGRFWTLPDVLPGGAARARGAYDAGAEIGDATLSHRELCRGGLLLQDATASRDGRLGSGRHVKAVRAAGAGWAHPALARRFDEPLAEQVERAISSGDLAPEHRPAGSDLLFTRVRVFGTSARGLIASAPTGETLLLAPALAAPELAFLDNLDHLAVLGLGFRAILRKPERGTALALLALAADDAPAEQGPRLELPPEWGGVCNLGYDRLQSAHVRERIPAPPHDPAGPPEPLDLVSRWIIRVLLGGRAAVPQAALPGLSRDAARLERLLMPGAGACLSAIGAAAGAGRDRFAEAWLAASIYEHAAARRQVTLVTSTGRHASK